MLLADILAVEEHAVDLAFALLGLQDNFDLAEFDQRKQNALVALLVGCPDKAAPYALPCCHKLG